MTIALPQRLSADAKPKHSSTAAPRDEHSSLRTGRAVERLVTRAPLFEGLTGPPRDALLERFTVRKLARGEDVFSPLEVDDSLYIVARGSVKTIQVDSSGKLGALDIFGPSDQFGEECVFDPQARQARATTLSTAVLGSTTGAQIFDWMAEYPSVARYVLRTVARRWRQSEAMRADMMLMDAPGRLARQLVLLANKLGSTCRDRVYVDHGLSQSDLARLVGASRETVNKTLGAFAKRGWLETGDRAFVLLKRSELERRGDLVGV
jgi:CRP/FNR family transcriptional regulator, cyclic AMP receptor protein